MSAGNGWVKRWSRLLALVAAISLLTSGGVNAQPAAPHRVALNQPGIAQRFVAGEVVVTFKPAAIATAGGSANLAAAAARAVDATAVQHMDTAGSDFYVFTVASGAEASAVTQLRQRGEVLAADLNHIRYLFGLKAGGAKEGGINPASTSTDISGSQKEVVTYHNPASADLSPNDPYYTSGYQWDMNTMQLPSAWNVTHGGAGVRVGIIDSGLDLSHPEFQGVIAGGYGVINGSVVSAQDDNGHGTHVAGTIGADTNNGQGIASVAWNEALFPCKAANAAGQLQSADWIACLNWEANNNLVRVVNMSFGGPSYDTNEQAAITNAYNHNIILVAAAGNNGDTTVNYPCAYTHVMCVAATGNLDEWAAYSDYNAYVDISAPGGNPSGNGDPDPNHWITSTYWQGSGYAYAEVAGTSQATPHVAGLAALMLACPGYAAYPQDTIVGLIENTAVDLGAAGRDNQFGYGRVNALHAMYPYFNDVSCAYWAFNYINWVAGMGIATGNNGNFRPNDAATRAEFSAMIVRAQGWAINTTGGPHFSDVPPSNPLYGYVETAYNHGVVQGTGGGNFTPNRAVRRDEVTAFLVRARGWAINTSGGPHFSDVPTSYTFYNTIETAYNHGAVSGVGGGRYQPSGAMTRAQLSKVLYQSYH